MSIFLVFVMCIGILSGCNQSNIDNKIKSSDNSIVKDVGKVAKDLENMKDEKIKDIIDKNKEMIDKAKDDEKNNEIDKNLQNIDGNFVDDFNATLISYIEKSEKGNENYVVSPLSIQLALSLLTEGAKEESLTELTKVLGVENVEQLRDVYSKYSQIMQKIEENNMDMKDLIFEMYGEYVDEKEIPNSSFNVSNSIWKNSDRPGNVLDEYKEIIFNYYDGTIENVMAPELKKKINDWVNNKTNGLIPFIVGDSVTKTNTVLVNTLYLRDNWRKEFTDIGNKEFTTIDNNKVTKKFMGNTETYGYYEDEYTKILVVPTDNRFNVVYVIGDKTNLAEKLDKVEYVEVIVELPYMDIESSFDNKFLVNYFKDLGVNTVFDEDLANFSGMIEVRPDYNIYVDDIIHKVKLKTDEKGIEGAAATAIMMIDNAALIEKPQPKEFIANVPFSFYVFSDLNENNNEVIFYGQFIK